MMGALGVAEAPLWKLRKLVSRADFLRHQFSTKLYKAGHGRLLLERHAYKPLRDIME